MDFFSSMWYSFIRTVVDIMNENIKLKNNKNNFSTAETILLVVISLIIGLSIGSLLNKNNIVTQSRNVKDEHLQEFIKNYEFILNNYYKDVDQESLINNAIAGMMDSLDDPYSMYFNEEESDNFSITLDGSYQGVGIQISKDTETDYMVVTAVFKSSPAFDAGIQAGDKIISVDGNNSSDMSTSEFSSLIRSSQKDTFLFKILRGDSNLDITVNKSIVTLNSVTSKVFELDNKKIGYIYIGIFANNTYSQFKKQLEELEDKNIDSLIIDVRGNTGGHLTAVDGILDLFLNSRQIMYQFEQNKKITSTYGKGKESKNYEIVLLGDEVSASASEVLIAGLKENLGSKFIGKKTYGKGTVQELVTLSDGTQYKITVKKWLTPQGNWINDTNGIVPDIEVELDNKYYTTYSDDEDTQLQAALDYLKSK